MTVKKINAKFVLQAIFYSKKNALSAKLIIAYLVLKLIAKYAWSVVLVSMSKIQHVIHVLLDVRNVKLNTSVKIVFKATTTEIMGSKMKIQFVYSANLHAKIVNFQVSNAKNVLRDIFFMGGDAYQKRELILSCSWKVMSKI